MIIKRKIIPIVAALSICSASPNVTLKTQYPRNHWSPASKETANSTLRPDVGITENDSSNVSAVTEITDRPIMEERNKIILITIVSNVLSILISSAVTFYFTRKKYRRTHQSQESANGSLLRGSRGIAESDCSNVSAVTEIGDRATMIIKRKIIPIVAALSICSASPNVTLKTQYPRNHWSPASKETANSTLRPDVGITENDSSNVSAVTEITDRPIMEERNKIILITIVSNVLSILISSAVTFYFTRKKYRRTHQSQESANGSLLRGSRGIAESDCSNVSAVTESEPQHSDHLYENYRCVKITGEHERTWRFPQSEKYTKVTIIPSLSEQEQAGHALTLRRMEGEEFWRKPEESYPEIPLDRLGVPGTNLIIGPCGSGKSTTIRKIMHDWAAGKMYKQISAVFPFRAQQLNFIQEKMSLNDLILEFFPNYIKSLHYLWEQPEKILFLFDDLNILQENFGITQMPNGNDHDSQSLEPDQCCEIFHIVLCLVQGQLLKGCSVLGTSSPWKLQTLGNVGSNRAVDILGFNEDAMKEYFQRCFADGQLASDVLHYLGQDKKLYAMCRNPQFCSVLCSVLESPQEEGAQMPAVISSTRVFLIYVMQLLNKHCYGNDNVYDMFLTLGSLAYRGVCNKTVVFKKGQLNKDKLLTYNWISAFMMEIQGNDGVDYVFTYSILKDFVAALFKYSNTPINEVTKLLTEWYGCTDDRFKFVSRFFIGLSSLNAMKQIGFYQGELHSEIASNVAEWLKKQFNSCVQNLKSEKNQNKFLEVLHCLLEFGNTTLMEDALTPLKRIRFKKCPLETFDCMVLSRALMMVQEIEELNLDSCGIKDEGIRQLEQVLHKCEVLSLKSNNLTDACVDTLFAALCKNNVLLKLDIGNDDPNDAQANRLTDESIPALFQFIQSNTHMKEFNLKYNNFSAEGLQRLKSVQASTELTVITE